MYAILDIETTGGKYDEEGITEIAIHKYDGRGVVDRFISLINPEREIQPFVVKLTGINNRMLTSAPKFHEVAKRIVEITQDAVLVAHNAQFDYRILRTEFRRLGFNYERKTLCTVNLSKRLIPEADSHSLGKLARSLGIPMSDRHRANGDALATLQLFKLLLNRDSDKSIIRQVIRAESLGELSPRQLDIVASTPAETGVYYMYNKDGDLIFLGNSTNIKRRVNQHFTNSGTWARTIQKETRKVTWEITGSELVARLKAEEERHINQPKYNASAEEYDEIRDYHKIVQGYYEEIDLAKNSVLLIDKGRDVGERSAVLLKNGIFRGLGFYSLNHQINNIHILETIITPMEGSPATGRIISSFLQEKKVLKIIEIN